MLLLENVCEGVPMICILCFGDQKVNAKNLLFCFQVLVATHVPGQEGQSWFQDTVDVVIVIRQFHWLFKDPRARNIENVLILSGDHLYIMNYMDLIQVHRENKAKLAIDCKRRCGWKVDFFVRDTIDIFM
ncbi:hypothetical protein Ahy_A04g018915 [Arachis hypogaea]|uniref:glucose-1-phosphate adenylyltransferase n=1 Tax=Arachis hypogaea TaxID=3818 RepID=A0A445DEY0_ARAHY|nr:hypothetical protein Ahy_A04g018915 [Arachis hypogaea]